MRDLSSTRYETRLDETSRPLRTTPTQTSNVMPLSLLMTKAVTRKVPHQHHASPSPSALLTSQLQLAAYSEQKTTEQQQQYRERGAVTTRVAAVSSSALNCSNTASSTITPTTPAAETVAAPRKRVLCNSAPATHRPYSTHSSLTSLTWTNTAPASPSSARVPLTSTVTTTQPQQQRIETGTNAAVCKTHSSYQQEHRNDRDHGFHPPQNIRGFSSSSSRGPSASRYSSSSTTTAATLRGTSGSASRAALTSSTTVRTAQPHIQYQEQSQQQRFTSAPARTCSPSSSVPLSSASVLFQSPPLQDSGSTSNGWYQHSAGGVAAGAAVGNSGIVPFPFSTASSMQVSPRTNPRNDEKLAGGGWAWGRSAPPLSPPTSMKPQHAAAAPTKTQQQQHRHNYNDNASTLQHTTTTTANTTSTSTAGMDAAQNRNNESPNTSLTSSVRFSSPYPMNSSFRSFASPYSPSVSMSTVVSSLHQQQGRKASTPTPTVRRVMLPVEKTTTAATALSPPPSLSVSAIYSRPTTPHSAARTTTTTSTTPSPTVSTTPTPSAAAESAATQNSYTYTSPHHQRLRRTTPTQPSSLSQQWRSFQQRVQTGPDSSSSSGNFFNNNDATAAAATKRNWHWGNSAALSSSSSSSFSAAATAAVSVKRQREQLEGATQDNDNNDNSRSATSSVGCRSRHSRSPSYHSSSSSSGVNNSSRVMHSSSSSSSHVHGSQQQALLQRHQQQQQQPRRQAQLQYGGALKNIDEDHATVASSTTFTPTTTPTPATTFTPTATTTFLSATAARTFQLPRHDFYDGSNDDDDDSNNGVTLIPLDTPTNNLNRHFARQGHQQKAFPPLEHLDLSGNSKSLYAANDSKSSVVTTPSSHLASSVGDC